MDRSIIDPPAAGSAARFPANFGTRSLLTVDTEEEFDWNAPFSRTAHSLDHVPRIARFQQFCEGIGVSPVYLVTWPIVQSDLAVDIIGTAVKAGKAEIGIQLHPWVSPPFDEDMSVANSFAGNLPPALEKAKFCALRDSIEQRFGQPPMIYRAGRYGLGPKTAALLRDTGIAIDTSVRANFDYRTGDGPDYSRHPLDPYWVDGPGSLLELPVTTVFGGMLRKQGRHLFPLLARLPKGLAIASRLGMLERIALTPEGVTTQEAAQGVDIAIDDGLPLLVFSFHSPSLAPGFTPYVRTEADLDRLYDWFRSIYDQMDARGVRPVSIAELMRTVEQQ
ncbi:hypothetical protein HME9302_01586 [Alteripontixanthobacter maritimus]|uniref:WalW protein n=1 Tax=Alteripontixanthobacter maritimus TaxID=2161824 RepID=A0A369Q681_9SPHN|nr:polysaccharide deacetylase family protein [Alteripontixanthobacter maritimus]RDC60381.1 hypothetical protein HME9302_01586 [Alteripontixanthobacter maritimus]